MTLQFKKTRITGLFIVENLLSDEECDYFLGEANKKKWEFIDRGIADYDRVVIVNEEWASSIYIKLKPFLPQEINDKYITGINDYFRFSKYHKGGRFEKHTDGINIDKKGNRALMTLNIFLNDIEEGGGTIFYENDIVEYIKASKGTAALFMNQIVHEGETVKENYKYLMRTDLMANEFI